MANEDFNKKDIPPPEERVEEETNMRVFAFLGILAAIVLVVFILVEASNRQTETAQNATTNGALNPAAGTASPEGMASPAEAPPMNENTPSPEATTPPPAAQ